MIGFNVVPKSDVDEHGGCVYSKKQTVHITGVLSVMHSGNNKKPRLTAADA